jgi:hypothetical protein
MCASVGYDIHDVGNFKVQGIKYFFLLDFPDLLRIAPSARQPRGKRIFRVVATGFAQPQPPSGVCRGLFLEEMKGSLI